MATTRPSRLSGQKILADLRLAGRKGDRSALTLALESMRTLAHSPRYWEKYLGLLRNPFARLVDLLVIKQGEKIAHQKGWNRRRGASPPTDHRRGPRRSPPSLPQDRSRGQSPRSSKTAAKRREAGAAQPSLFE